MGRAIVRWLKQAADNRTANQFNEAEANEWFDKYVSGQDSKSPLDLDTMLDLSAKYNLWQRRHTPASIAVLNKAKPLLGRGDYNKYRRADQGIVSQKLINLIDTAQAAIPLSKRDSKKFQNLEKLRNDVLRSAADDTDSETTEAIASYYKPTPWQVRHWKETANKGIFEDVAGHGMKTMGKSLLKIAPLAAPLALPLSTLGPVGLAAGGLGVAGLAATSGGASAFSLESDLARKRDEARNKLETYGLSAE